MFFLSLWFGELTRWVVMFWSKKSKMHAIMPGIAAAKRAHTGRPVSATRHGRPEVVVSCAGTARHGSIISG